MKGELLNLTLILLPKKTRWYNFIGESNDPNIIYNTNIAAKHPLIYPKKNNKYLPKKNTS